MEIIDPTGWNLNTLIKAPELSSVKSQIEDMIECVKKVSSMRAILYWEMPELKSLFILVNELYNCKVYLKYLEEKVEDETEEKEREIFKKYFNQIIDNLLDGNTDWKHKKNL